MGPDPNCTIASFQHLGGSVLGVYFFDDALQDAILREDKGAAQGAQHRLAVHFLLAPGTKRLQHLGRSIGQQPERQLILGPEARMRLGRVLAHAHHIVPRSRQSRIIIAERARLGRAARRVVLGVKVNNGLAAITNEIIRPNDLTILIHHLKLRHLITNLQHIPKF